MQQKINLTSQQILEKCFNIDFKGYAGQEVDEFLDLVVADYDNFTSTITELGKILVEYEEKIEQLTKENEALRNATPTTKSHEITSHNHLELLTRIARLEAAVFKK